MFDQYTRRGRAEGREEGVRGIIKFCKELNIGKKILTFVSYYAKNILYLLEQ